MQLEKYRRSCKFIRTSLFSLSLSINQKASKCLVLVSTDKLVGFKIGDKVIQNSAYKKLLSVAIDFRLNFHKHIRQMCVKARSVARISPNKNRGKSLVIVP